MKEAINIFQRGILSFHQNGFTMDPLVPLFPKSDLYHEINATLAQDIVKKRFLLRQSEAENVVKRLLISIESYREECHKYRNFPKPPITHEEDDNKKTLKLIVGTFESPPSVRLRYLVQTFGEEPTATMLMRYEAAGSGSYQWGDPVSVHRLYYVEFGARHEGFSSPLNSRFLGQSGIKFCSAFPDVDAPFGCVGNFFQVDLGKHEGGWTVNPPFIESVLERAAEKVLQCFQNGHKCYFFMNFPYWTDSRGWQLLDQSPHKTARFDFEAGEFLIQDSYGGSIRPRMKLSIFVMGTLPADSSPVSRVYDVVHREKPEGY
jgi:hypothetical protein